MIHLPIQQSGFSLVEVLVAITILLLVVVGPMSIITQSNNSSAFATEQAQAFFFAQEGIELVQKARDDLLLEYFSNEFAGTATGTPPFVQLGSSYNRCFNAVTGCGLSINNSANLVMNDCTVDGTSCRLYEQPASSRLRYTHASNSNATPYIRVIKLRRIGSDNDQLEVTSTVTWRTGSLIASQEVVLTSYLFDIYDTN